MSKYSYRARNHEGLPINGVVEADSELAVAANLQSLGYSVIHIERLGALKKQIEQFFQKFQKVSQQEIILFARQLSTMLKSGLPLTAALESLSRQIKHKLFNEVVLNIIRDIEKGSSFSEALTRHPHIFNELFVNMIKVGETAGILDEILDRLVVLNTQELDMRMRVQSAMVYPIILVIAAVAIVSFLLVAIIPKFVAVFETYEARLPLATQFLLIISHLIRRIWYIVLIGVTGFILWVQRYMKTEHGRYRIHAILLKIPILGEFYLKVIVSRFARILGVLVRSGVSILDALSVTENTIGNVVLSRVIQRIRQAVSEGKSLEEPFQASGIFPPMVIQMVSVGEKSGKIDQMLVDIATYYDQETEYAIKNATTVLEPLLLLAMGGLVAFIALSVLLPIFNLIKVFRGGI